MEMDWKIRTVVLTRRTTKSLPAPKYNMPVSPCVLKKDLIPKLLT